MKTLVYNVCKRRGFQCVFFTISMLFLFLTYFLLINIIKDSNYKKLEITTEKSIYTDIVKCELNNGKYSVFGWVLRLDSYNEDIKVVLHDMMNESNILLKPFVSNEQSIGQYFNQNWNFGDNFFSAEFDKNSIDVNSCYEIHVILKYKSNGSDDSKTAKVSTNQYLYNGNIYRYNPLTFKKPDSFNKEIEEVVAYGKVLHFDSESMCWIYLYDDEICTIVPYEMLGELDMNSQVSLICYTTQPDKLSDNDAVRNYQQFNHYLTIEDYVNKEDSIYYLQKYTLPKTFPISEIEVGVWGNISEGRGWIWNKKINFNSAYGE